MPNMIISNNTNCNRMIAASRGDSNALPVNFTSFMRDWFSWIMDYGFWIMDYGLWMAAMDNLIQFLE